MPIDDKKEYKDFLLLLSHTASAPTILNKLDQQIMKMADPRLKINATNIANFFRSEPEFVHYKKFRLLSFATAYSANSGTRKMVSDATLALERYCHEHIKSQIPQWELIARAAGWIPPNGTGR